MKVIRNNIVWILCILISLPLISSYFHPGFFSTHDGEWAIVRLGDMFRTLRDFQIPPRYSGALNFGYGYPLFNFAYPFPYYVGTLIHLLGFSFVDSIKILFASTVPLSAVGMYFASNALWKSRWAGLVSSILYVYLPYRMVDLYVRGSIGESLAFVLFPVVFYFSLKSLENRNVVYGVLAGVSYGCLIMTHNIMAVLFTPVFLLLLVSYALIYGKNYRSIMFPVISGLLFSAFFWLPAISEKSNILLSRIPIADRNLYFVTLNQLVIPRWGYGVPDQPNGFSYQIGMAQLAIFITSLIALFTKINTRWDREYKMVMVLVLVFTVVLSMMFSFSSPIWKLPFLSEVNYPWTLLAISGFLISLIAGFIASHGTVLKITALGLCCVAIISTISYAKPAGYVQRGDQYYLTNPATTTSSSELMPVWVKLMPSNLVSDKVVILSGKGSIDVVSYNSKKITFKAHLDSDSTISIQTIYYPGWTMESDNKLLPITYNNEYGVMRVGLTKGDHVIMGSFSETPLRMWADTISIVTAIGLGSLVIFKIRKKRYE